MTDLLKLSWASDDEADQDLFDLLDGSQGLTMLDDGWTPATMADDQIVVTETMTLYLRGVSHDKIAEYTQKLNDWKQRVKWSKRPEEYRVVWLNARWKTETETCRAVVYSLNYTLGYSPFAPYLRDDNFTPITIVIERGWWEELTLSRAAIPVLNALGGKVQLKDYGTGLVNQTTTGDVPARFVELAALTTPSASLRYWWFGTRSSYLGALANFESIWKLKDANYFLTTSSDTSVVVDATAYSGSNVTTTFAATAVVTPRFRISAINVTAAHYEDQRGKFQCLLRAKMSDTSIARVRINSGFFSGSTASPYNVNLRAVVQGTAWTLYDLGMINLPAIEDKRIFTPDPTMTFAGIELEAERVSGSGNLIMDCFVLVPIDDAFVRLDFETDQSEMWVRVNPFEHISANGELFKQGSLDQITWSMPANNEAPLFVVSGQRNAGSVLADTLQAYVAYVRRWRTLRGAE